MVVGRCYSLNTPIDFYFFCAIEEISIIYGLLLRCWEESWMHEIGFLAKPKVARFVHNLPPTFFVFGVDGLMGLLKVCSSLILIFCKRPPTNHFKGFFIDTWELYPMHVFQSTSFRGNLNTKDDLGTCNIQHSSSLSNIYYL